MTEEWPWLTNPPTFTTHGEKHGNVTLVPDGAVLEPLGLELLRLVLGLAIGVALTVAGVGLILASLSEDFGPASWWWLALAVPAATLAVFALAGVHVRGMELLMRERPRTLLLASGLLGGTAAGLFVLAAWWVWRATDSLYAHETAFAGWGDQRVSQAVLLGSLAPAAAVACVITGAAAVRGVRRARTDVARILRLRATGTRISGFVAALPDPADWDEGGDVPVRFGEGDAARVITVRLNTTPTRIPVPGTRVIVFTEDDDLLVELDPEQEIEYHPHSSRYETSQSGGGS